MSIVYILTNEYMPDIIKIGRTRRDLEERIKEISRETGVPFPFECCYAVDVGDENAAKDIERKMHQGLADCRIHPIKEFFNTTPEQAKSLLGVAETMGGKDVTPSDDITADSQEKQALDKKRRQRFNFKMVGIEVGTTLCFKKDPEITCEVADDTQVIFRDEKTSLSNSARIVLQEMGIDWSSFSGTLWWCLGEKTLHELRLEKE